MGLRNQCVLTRGVGRSLKPQDVHGHHPEAALYRKMYVVTIQNVQANSPNLSQLQSAPQYTAFYRQMNCCDLLRGHISNSPPDLSIYRSKNILENRPFRRPVFVMTDRIRYKDQQKLCSYNTSKLRVSLATIE